MAHRFPYVPYVRKHRERHGPPRLTVLVFLVFVIDFPHPLAIKTFFALSQVVRQDNATLLDRLG